MKLVKPLRFKLIWPALMGFSCLVYFIGCFFYQGKFSYWSIGVAALFLYAATFCFDVESSFKYFFLTGDIKKVGRFDHDKLAIYGLLRIVFIGLNYLILSCIAILILAGMYNLMGQSTFFICASILLAGYFYNRNSNK